jgi:hypothetical protein
LSREPQTQTVNARRELTVQALKRRHIAGSGRRDRIQRLTAGIHGKNSLQRMNHAELEEPGALNV